MTTFDQAPQDLPETVTASEAAKLFGFHRGSVYRWVDKGWLSPVTTSDPLRYLTADIAAITGHPSFPAQSLDDRLWNKVSKTETCWLWLGTINRGGYGRINVGGRTQNAHRFVYEHLIGSIPDDMEMDHLCRVRHCVNPDHLEPVTKRENILRGTGASARNAAKTHCKRGHEFTPENTYVWRGSTRQCKECGRLRSASRRASKGASQ